MHPVFQEANVRANNQHPRVTSALSADPSNVLQPASLGNSVNERPFSRIPIHQSRVHRHATRLTIGYADSVPRSAVRSCSAAGSGSQPAPRVPLQGVVAPVCPAATANGRFVRFLYLQILMRCPDASGGAYWTAKLDHGSARSAVADVLDMSTENVVNNNVVPLYQGLLGRAPSSTELAAGVNSIRSTHGDAELIRGPRFQRRVLRAVQR